MLIENSDIFPSKTNNNWEKGDLVFRENSAGIRIFKFVEYIRDSKIGFIGRTVEDSMFLSKIGETETLSTVKYNLYAKSNETGENKTMENEKTVQKSTKKRGNMATNTEVTKPTVNKKAQREKIMDKTIFNAPATIVFWGDSNKTVVKTMEGDTYNPEFGFLQAYFEKHSGLTRTQVNKFMRELRESYAKQCLANVIVPKVAEVTTLALEADGTKQEVEFGQEIKPNGFWNYGDILEYNQNDHYKVEFFEYNTEKRGCFEGLEININEAFDNFDIESFTKI